MLAVFISRFILIFILPALFSQIARTSTASAEEVDTQRRPVASAIGDNPPRNPYLADSTWPMSHAGPYNQGSSAAPGPRWDGEATPSLLPGEAVPITLAISSPYPDGRRVVWGKTLKQIVKIDMLSSQPRYFARLDRENSIETAISGAYSLVDCDGLYFTPQGAAIEAYGDAVAGDATSPIELKHRFVIPSGLSEQPVIVGISLTYDGRVVFLTAGGLVGSLSRTLEDPEYLQLDLKDEGISNSIAIDEEGGIYVLTSKQVYRVNWDASGDDRLALAWNCPYSTSDVRRSGRLGDGSGTTPSLVGTGEQDKFVAICDGQEVMHMVLIWRDDIPSDWQGLPGKPRRIAAEVPVTFGDPDVKRSTTEQSITVRGYGLVTVSNDYGRIGPIVTRIYQRHGVGTDLATIHQSNRASIAPYGVEKFVWDPGSRELKSVWVNREVSCPNGVPTMSAQTGLFYCIGQRDSTWTLEALDWETGEAVFHVPLSRGSEYNSFYAATEIGPDGMILTGTYGGCLRFWNTDRRGIAQHGNF